MNIRFGINYCFASHEQIQPIYNDMSLRLSLFYFIVEGSHV